MLSALCFTGWRPWTTLAKPGTKEQLHAHTNTTSKTSPQDAGGEDTAAATAAVHSPHDDVTESRGSANATSKPAAAKGKGAANAPRTQATKPTQKGGGGKKGKAQAAAKATGNQKDAPKDKSGQTTQPVSQKAKAKQATATMDATPTLPKQRTAKQHCKSAPAKSSSKPAAPTASTATMASVETLSDWVHVGAAAKGTMAASSTARARARAAPTSKGGGQQPSVASQNQKERRLLSSAHPKHHPKASTNASATKAQPRPASPWIPSRLNPSVATVLLSNKPHAAPAPRENPWKASAIKPAAPSSRAKKAKATASSSGSSTSGSSTSGSSVSFSPTRMDIDECAAAKPDAGESWHLGMPADETETVDGNGSDKLARVTSSADLLLPAEPAPPAKHRIDVDEYITTRRNPDRTTRAPDSEKEKRSPRTAEPAAKTASARPATAEPKDTAVNAAGDVEGDNSQKAKSKKKRARQKKAQKKKGSTGSAKSNGSSSSLLSPTAESFVSFSEVRILCSMCCSSLCFSFLCFSFL